MTAPLTPTPGPTWQQPTFLLPLFCLITLLGSSNSLAVAIGMAVITCLLTLCFSVLTHYLMRVISGQYATIVQLVCAATLMACAELLLHAACPELHRRLGIYLPMSIIACLLLARSELQSESSPLKKQMWRATRMSGGYTLAAVVLGAARELVGHGSLFADASLILGTWAAPLEWQIFPADMGFLLAILTPGAFIALGLGVALYNFLWLQLKKPSSAS